ncbi:single-stranded nucleic acid binding protein R3H domain-containing protein [Trypanosoma theileri]|uniref:Single-stranded nucleic acid binding protein R3H domain-containing protein n=1 Tax=Trypanosoma theileri TaxID=67003 RepID=A0A1X0P383_9TRYP|nr:single-stranded nucleic acid binding protein R3H domain-containing protein [Trypanosoma theileri]ORC90870.1 single-stranded nucleic acid binding protein R3H domain-containing protein [Trypanosoma theileri]
MILSRCQLSTLRPIKESFFYFRPTFHSKRFIRSRRVSFNTEYLTRADQGLPENASQRQPPTAMPLNYLKSQIMDLEQYQTDNAIWLNDNLREAWKTFHQSLATAMCKEDALKMEHIINKDLVGLALCTSHAEVKHLLSMLAPSLRSTIVSHPTFVPSEVEEFFIHIGQEMEIRGGNWVLQLPSPSVSELQFTIDKVGRFGDDGRGCIQNTPHRVSVWRGRRGEALGLTIRVGRFVPNVARALLPLAHKGSVLILSKAGIGKTTLLRDLAASLSREISKPRVMVVDTSNEIGGDSPVPLPFLGRCRRIQVAKREEQGNIMTQILQNHSPEYVIVDEIATSSEAEAAWSISQRGVHLIATCHGESLASLLQNQSLNLLVGGAAQAFLSNEERRLRNKSKKTILERPHASPFRFVVELKSRNTAHIYIDVNTAVDLILDDQDAEQNASVGIKVNLDQPPSDELMSMLYAKEKKAQLDAERRRKGQVNVEMISNSSDDLDTNPNFDYDDSGESDGGIGRKFNRQWKGDRMRKRPMSGRKRTDEDLWEDLRSFQ